MNLQQVSLVNTDVFLIENFAHRLTERISMVDNTGTFK